MNTTYTISELSAVAGVTNRTIRYYTTQGLLPPPDSRGKYARYTEEHLLRLRLIARLKDAYLPLNEIKARIAPLNLDEVRRMITADDQRESTANGALPTLDTQTEQPQSTAGATPATTTPSPPRGGGFLSKLMPRLREQPTPLGEGWQRIVLAPGVELHLREPLSPDQRTRAERLIAQARELFG